MAHNTPQKRLQRLAAAAAFVGFGAYMLIEGGGGGMGKAVWIVWTLLGAAVLYGAWKRPVETEAGQLKEDHVSHTGEGER